jgi:CHAT domain-containing protein/tetratricopeptide (TPR) repeat protein
MMIPLLLALHAAPALPALPALRDAPPALTGEVCEARYRERPADLESYRCFWLLARQNRAEEAERRLRHLLLREPANPRARLYLARIGGDQGRDWAETMYGEAITGFAAAGDAHGEVLARLGLSLFFNRRHRVAEQAAEVEAAFRVSEASGDRTLQAWVRQAQGQLLLRQGDYGAAWRILKEVEAEVFPEGPADLQALCLGNLSGVCQQMGRNEAALEYVRRAAELCRRSGDFYDEARHRGNLVLCATRLAVQGQMEPATTVVLARDALDAALRGGNRGSEARAHLYLGDLLPGLEGRQHYRSGLALSRETKETAGLIIALRGLALSLVEHEPRDPAQAYRLADQAFELARGDRWYTAFVQLGRARMRWITGPREQAIAESLATLDWIEAIRDLQDEGVVRARVFSLWAFMYDAFAGHLLQDPDPSPGELELAFSVIERKRSRVLLDELDAAQATATLAPLDPARERRQAVLKQIAGVQRRLMDAALAEAERRKAIGELERLELEEAALRAEFLRRDAAYAALRRPRLPALQVVERALRDDEAILSFQVAAPRNADNRTTENASWLWAHTREGTRVYPVPDRDALRSPVSLFLGLFERRDGSEAEAAPHLYDALLRRAIDDLPRRVRRLVFVPDGILHRLPFDALRPARDGEPLGARYETSVAPSVTLWLRWRREKTPTAATPALAVADPEFPFGVVAPGTERAALLAAARHVGALPHARQEARAAVRRLGGGSLFKAGREATEPFLKTADLRRFGVLHFAAHALIDEERPERSAILLAPGRDGDDGLLQIREVVGLDLRGRVVVLSACRSASGALLEGEGVMGLARAFFQAGARTVVGSLWPLRDDDAARLFDSFYRGLAEGRSVGAALAAARREQIRSGRPAAAWAGIVLLGDGTTVPLPGGRAHEGSRKWVTTAAVLTLLPLLVVAGLAWRRRS